MCICVNACVYEAPRSFAEPLLKGLCVASGDFGKVPL